MARVETEGAGYNLLERIVYLFLIPAVFTAILTVVLLNLFGYNVMDPILRAANRVPLLERIVPDPAVEVPPSANSGIGGQTGGQAGGQTAGPAEQPQTADQEAILRLENDLSTARAESAAKDARIAELELQVKELEDRLQARAVAQDEYMQEIRRLAMVYEDMSASKAAPILEQLGTNDRMLILSQMEVEAQTKILARMNPAVAAETTLQQIAEFRARLLGGSAEAVREDLRQEELGRTVSGMTPNAAAILLLELADTDEAKAINILRDMDVQSRSAVMTAMAQQSREGAARLTAGLADSAAK
jgi:flagellar motility protein MotE (MotC chaperone)